MNDSGVMAAISTWKVFPSEDTRVISDILSYEINTRRVPLPRSESACHSVGVLPEGKEYGLMAYKRFSRIKDEE